MLGGVQRILLVSRVHEGCLASQSPMQSGPLGSAIRGGCTKLVQMMPVVEERIWVEGCSRNIRGWCDHLDAP